MELNDSMVFDVFEDYPIKGVNFFDIGSMLKNPRWIDFFKSEINKIAFVSRPDYVVGIESRGFIFGTVASYTLDCGFVMARKPGKLPGKTVVGHYGKEYGKDTIEIQLEKIVPGKKYLLCDDILATGNTIKATADLITQNGGIVCGILVYGEIDGLGARAILEGYDIYSVVTLHE